MAVISPSTTRNTPPGRRLLSRRVMRVLIVPALACLALWASCTLGIMALSYWARAQTPPPAGTVAVQGIHHFQPVADSGHLWRGGAPTSAGYRALADLGFTTVVDLRAEHLSAAERAEPTDAGLKVVSLPIRDGQTPRPAQVHRFLDVVADTNGKVFVHCGAGVGRVGAMTAAYLVETGQESPLTATWHDLAVGPSSIEQIYYELHLSPTDADQPPAAVVILSRLIDAPRRIISHL